MNVYWLDPRENSTSLLKLTGVLMSVSEYVVWACLLMQIVISFVFPPLIIDNFYVKIFTSTYFIKHISVQTARIKENKCRFRIQCIFDDEWYDEGKIGGNEKEISDFWWKIQKMMVLYLNRM